MEMNISKGALYTEWSSLFIFYRESEKRNQKLRKKIICIEKLHQKRGSLPCRNEFRNEFSSDDEHHIIHQSYMIIKKIYMETAMKKICRTR